MVPLLLFLSGVILVGFGIYRYKGPVSVWYLAYGTYTVGHNYLAMPGGISTMLFALLISPFVPVKWKMPILILAIAIIIVGLIFAKRLWAPVWLRWLEQEHKDIIPILQAEIQKMGPDVWDKRINTREELESWVAEIRRKHKVKPKTLPPKQ